VISKLALEEGDELVGLPFVSVEGSGAEIKFEQGICFLRRGVLGCHIVQGRIKISVVRYFKPLRQYQDCRNLYYKFATDNERNKDERNFGDRFSSTLLEE
jgi:hypothetical protein